MKLLMIYTSNFSYKPTTKTLDDFPDVTEGKKFKNVQTAFIQVEEEDIDKGADFRKKILKNLKWVCGKNDTKHIILHSFAHLSESKADPKFTKELFDEIEERLINAGYMVDQTPFGYFLDLSVEAPGFSLARVFKSF